MREVYDEKDIDMFQFLIGRLKTQIEEKNWQKI